MIWVGRDIQLAGKRVADNGKERRNLIAHIAFLCVELSVLFLGFDKFWISFTFDPPRSNVPLEGMTGSEDSGSPLLIKEQ
jgi:hypothetical protein